MSYTAAVMTISDKGYAGHQREDTSSPNLCRIVKEYGYELAYTSIVPDDMEMIKTELIRCCDELKINLILTAGGTGFSPVTSSSRPPWQSLSAPAPAYPRKCVPNLCASLPRAAWAAVQQVSESRALSSIFPAARRPLRKIFFSVISAVDHGLEMPLGEGSADCAASAK